MFARAEEFLKPIHPCKLCERFTLKPLANWDMSRFYLLYSCILLTSSVEVIYSVLKTQYFIYNVVVLFNVSLYVIFIFSCHAVKSYLFQYASKRHM